MRREDGKVKSKRLIVVLGMHRSGTSSITSGLQVLGVGLGNRLLPPLEGNNAKGFFEDIDLNVLNIDMLQALESDWHYISPIEANDVDVLRKKGYFLRAVELLRQKVADAPSFGFKDPRVAKLLPFWKQVFAYCQFDVGYVMALRHPLSVVKSLAKRDGFNSEKSYMLWLGHVLTSLSNTKGHKCVLVDYDRLMYAPERELERIAECLALQIDPKELQRYKSEFLDEGLRHTVYDLNDLVLDDTCPPLVYEIYATLIDVAADRRRIEDVELQTHIALWINEFERLKSNLHLIDRLFGKISSLNQAVVERDGQISSLNQTVAERDGQISSLNQAVAEQDGQIARLNQVVAERDGQIDELKRVHMEQVQRLDAELLSVYLSKSWRITAPLRKLMTAIRCPKSRPSKKAELNDIAIRKKNDARQNSKPLASVTATQQAPIRILLVSYYCPTRAHAGGLRILDIYTLIKERHPYTQLDLYTHYRPNIDWSLDEIYQVFDNIYLSPNEDLSSEGFRTLSNLNDIYNVVDLQFHQLGKHIDGFRRLGKKIIFTPMESLARVFYMDLKKALKKDGDVRLKEIAKGLHLAVQEVKFSLKSDETICVSRSDEAFLRFLTGSRKIRSLETGLSRLEFVNVLSKEKIEIVPEKKAMHIVYVAYFGSETNIIALRWYLNHVHPHMKAQVPEYMLSVVGRGDLTPFAGYDDGSIEFVGEVPSIAPYVEQAKVGIAPALGGAGFRGKVNQYAVFGVPSVVSSIALKGLAYKDTESIFVADSPELFAQRCVELLTDDVLNAQMGTKARLVCLDRYTWESKWTAICDIYNLEDLK